MVKQYAIQVKNDLYTLVSGLSDGVSTQELPDLMKSTFPNEKRYRYASAKSFIDICRREGEDIFEVVKIGRFNNVFLKPAEYSKKDLVLLYNELSLALAKLEHYIDNRMLSV